MQIKPTEILHRKGYLLKVTSWENDGDNYSTAEYSTDSLEDAKNIYEFCQLFGNDNSDLDIGNIYEPDAEEAQKAKEVVVNFYKQHRKILDTPMWDDDEIYDAMTDLANMLGLIGSEFYTRVCDNVVVYHIPEDVYAQQIVFN